MLLCDYPLTSSVVVGVSTSIVSGRNILIPSLCGLPNQEHEDSIATSVIIHIVNKVLMSF